MKHFNSSELARSLLSEKLKYWYHTLSQQAIEINFFNMFDLIDYFRLVYDLTIFDSIFSSLIFSLTLEIKFTEIPVFNFCYEIELPSPEDFARGQLLRIKCVPCLEKYPDIGRFLYDLFFFIKTHFSENLARTFISKGRYGISKYGESYYDPSPIYEALRSTFLSISKKKRGLEAIRASFNGLIKGLDANYEAVDYFYTLLLALDNMKYTAPTAEYGWSDISISPEEVEEGEVKVDSETLKREKVELKSMGLQEIVGGSTSDIATADLSFTADEDSPEVPEVPHESKNALVAIADLISRDQKERLTSTPLLIANYQNIEERLNPEASTRTHTFGSSRIIYYKLKELVDREVKEDKAFIKNQYNVAVQQLYGRLTRDGGWGEEAYRSMSIEELKRTWIAEWVEKGLDEKTLDSLFNKAIKAIQIYTPLRARSKIMLKARYTR